MNLIDARYRTLATNASRGITGFSMGGHGAMHLALNFPNSFSVVVAQSGYYDTADAVTDGALTKVGVAEVESSHYQKLFTCGYFPSAISRNSQARAQAHCRSIVLGETPRAAAVSGTVMPAK